MIPQIYLRKGKEESLLRRHPWIFSGAIDHIKAEEESDFAEGALVEVYTRQGEFMALGHYQVGSIAVRVLTFEREDIGKYPTRDRNNYLVLYLNFSGIIGELHNYRAGLDAHCQTCFDYFCDIYAEYLPQGIKEQLDAKNGAVEQLDYLYHECERAGQDIYLFIDEYDHFINAILSDVESLHRYTKETHKEGYLRAFFNKIKSGTYSSIKRCFITGVSPVTMDVVVSRGIL